ncbi:triphosphoribosyl-dephospho-CoA synthase [Acinetobacter pittii]|uniref:triphosphoribosyl-dephospho-CoA synthase n=1 Tax=Acinetobacter pittii TaxID=48296 RepID=UPI001EFEC386|nr:triphosphoribosyl-dephospho-CoA synthase [Acinetobacter pittii]MCG9512844.1 triphosphoribosyl-dephospho-CoA synthase [Acinetobacter pittii]
MMAQVQYQTLSGSQLLASLAIEALIDEVNLTPKPALVDRRGSGAHDDLTLELMERSAKSLGPMFEEMAQAAMHHGEVCLALREDIGEIGRQGEKVMMLATDGVNTHRGAIWALGLMVTAAALARTNQQYLSAVELCQLAGQIAQFEDRFIPEQALSHGQQVQKKLGILGAKDQAQQGFPTIVNFGLKQFYQSRSKPMKEEFARLDALLAMMTDLTDTCVLYRSGTSGLKRMQQGAQQVLDLGGSSSLEGRRALHLLEIDLLRMKASAGGAADLLAATLFIDRVEQSSSKNKEGF